ncbi:MAG TPA: nucleotidyltransferase family protein [Alphaproteobacteria bacterium]|nr:nucleotidyltransferase family protein [Alphaproteobacteria bacterium]
MSETKIAGIVAVILAAGLSSRMAPQNKLLLEFGGEKLVHRLAREALASAAKQVIVVIGHDRWNVRKALADLPVTLVENPDYTESQMTSVRAGVLAAPEADGYLIIPGDMPLLGAGDFDRLIARFGELKGEKAVVPFDEAERGNPIVIPGWSREEMYRRGINFGCRNLLINYPELVAPLKTAEPQFFQDCDTEEAYRDLLALFAARQGLAKSA